MTIEELQKFIDEQDTLFRSLKDRSQSERERIFSRVIKLGEEYGELCDQVLCSQKDQRKDKLLRGSRQDLEDEFSDVVICLFMLAKAMDVDVMQTLDYKVQMIKERHNKQL